MNSYNRPQLSLTWDVVHSLLDWYWYTQTSIYMTREDKRYIPILVPINMLMCACYVCMHFFSWFINKQKDLGIVLWFWKTQQLLGELLIRLSKLRLSPKQAGWARWILDSSFKLNVINIKRDNSEIQRRLQLLDHLPSDVNM